MFGIDDAGRWSLIRRVSTAVNASGDRDPDRSLNDEQLERLVTVYLQRWGVLCRKILERETFAPSWRCLVRVLRKMELRGDLRGGRFIAGVGGEQFAFTDTVDALRKSAKHSGNHEYVALAASDPLNLLGFIEPNIKLPRLLSNRILYRDGIPLATLKGTEVRFLNRVADEEKWKLQQLLLQRHFPPRLRSYLGRQIH